MFTKHEAAVLLALWGFAWSGAPLHADDEASPIIATIIEPSVSFQRHQFTISRSQGKVYIDGNEVAKNVLETQSKVVRLIEIFDGMRFASDRQFMNWAHKLRSTRTYTYDIVTQVGPDGATTIQPLVFFDKDQRFDLDAKWHAWLDKRQAEADEANRLRQAQEQEAKQYQQQAQLQEIQTKALQAQAAAAEKSVQSLAVISGATSLWEVELVPVGSSGACTSCSFDFGSLSNGTLSSGVSLFANGGSLSSAFGSSFNYGRVSHSIYINAYGRTSQVAGDKAIQDHPGYRVGSVRKLAGY